MIYPAPFLFSRFLTMHEMNPEIDRSASQQVTPHLLIGALAGLVAAAPMGLFMTTMHRYLPRREKYPLPPRLITTELAERAGVKAYLGGEEGRSAATWLSHLGYGAVTAAPYPLITRSLPLPPILRGMVYALGVWTGSYMGWLPAFNIMPPATQVPKRRNLLMIAAHLLWGAVIGYMVEEMEQG